MSAALLHVIFFDEGFNDEQVGYRSRTANEKGVSGEDSPVISIFNVVADTVLRVAWCMQSGDLDALADGERLVMRRRLVH